MAEVANSAGMATWSGPTLRSDKINTLKPLCTASAALAHNAAKRASIPSAPHALG